MARSRRNPWDEDCRVAPSDFFVAAVKAQQSESGRSDVIVSSAAQQVVVGLPLYWPGEGPVHRHHSLALRWLFGNNVFPLGRMIELVGKSRSFKSTFAYELLRLHLLYGGGYRFLLAEPRDTPDMRASILGQGCDQSFPLIKCPYIEDWQSRAVDVVKDAVERFSDLGSCPFPGAILVDSITGVTCRASGAKIWDEGFAELDYARDANLISKWCKVYFGKLEEWPFSFIGTNHLKESPRTNGPGMDRRVPGGAALEFAATFIFRFARDEQGDYQNSEEEGRVITIHTQKNSLGTDKRALKTRVAWRTGDDGLQQTEWKWHDASIELLVDLKGPLREKAYDVCDLHDVLKTHRTVSSRALGLTKVSWKEASEAIEQNPGIREALDKALGIRQRYAWRPGVPYRNQLLEARTTADSITPPTAEEPEE